METLPPLCVIGFSKQTFLFKRFSDSSDVLFKQHIKHCPPALSGPIAGPIRFWADTHVYSVNPCHDLSNSLFDPQLNNAELFLPGSP